MPEQFSQGGRWRAGDSIEDVCRACKADRMHTVIAVDPLGGRLRVQCGYCGSQHNFRGIGKTDQRAGAGRHQESVHASGSVAGSTRPGQSAPPSPPAQAREPLAAVTDRERTEEAIMIETPDGPGVDLELLLRRVIREETGLTPVVPAEKWRGGSFVLRPATPGLQEKSWPVEAFFHKVVMIRNRLRTLEQQLNALDVPEDVKVRLQSYITGCYGSLTSFNILFADESDRFKGTAAD